MMSTAAEIGITYFVSITSARLTCIADDNASDIVRKSYVNLLVDQSFFPSLSSFVPLVDAL
jgi:hypothetical protein